MSSMPEQLQNNTITGSGTLLPLTRQPKLTNIEKNRNEELNKFASSLKSVG